LRGQVKWCQARGWHQADEKHRRVGALKKKLKRNDTT
jgi:hypothetical protein